MKNNKEKKDYFKYVVILVVLLIPFMYSFFYLKAYWNPYGEGNIDNLPVAIVNEDEGDKGEKLIDSIKESGKLKISVVTEKNADEGLYNQDYYAVIKIPKDFTASMESASTTNKSHATITYSPNQKANYLASQIINSVVNAVEKNLDNSINSAIVDTLSEQLNSVPSELKTISNGFTSLSNGINQLQTGSNSLTEGLSSLNSSYTTFNSGLKSLKEGANALNTATSKLSELTTSAETLTTAVNTINDSSNQITAGTDKYVTSVNTVLDFTEASAKYIVTVYEMSTTHNGIPDELYINAKKLLTEIESYGNNNTITYLKQSGTTLNEKSKLFNSGINQLNTQVSSLSTVTSSITLLQEKINQLSTGTDTLYENSLKIEEAINTLSNGSNTLTEGIKTLNSSVSSAKNELDENITTTEEKLKSLEGLKEYSESPINMVTTPVNEVSSYGTAFSPFFISIALWVGCLMMYIVLYYDKDKRFKTLGIDSDKLVKRTICYHGLATLSAIILAIILELFLDFEITSQVLYFGSIILIANAFMAIIEFLIVNFKDVGKFVALILLVLQLAAAGGTFPIETVTKGFRWLNPYLPMTYTVNLLKESLISIENDLLIKNILIVSIIFICLFAINIILDKIREKKQNN